jgi:hypothetical protein
MVIFISSKVLVFVWELCGCILDSWKLEMLSALSTLSHVVAVAFFIR